MAGALFCSLPYLQNLKHIVYVPDTSKTLSQHLLNEQQEELIFLICQCFNLLHFQSQVTSFLFSSYLTISHLKLGLWFPSLLARCLPSQWHGFCGVQLR